MQHCREPARRPAPDTDRVGASPGQAVRLVPRSSALLAPSWGFYINRLPDDLLEPGKTAEQLIAERSP